MGAGMAKQEWPGWPSGAEAQTEVGGVLEGLEVQLDMQKRYGFAYGVHLSLRIEPSGRKFVMFEIVRGANGWRAMEWPADAESSERGD